MSFLERVVLGTIVVALIGCRDESSPLNTVPVGPSLLSLTSGNEQVGEVGKDLASPVVIRVRDHYGNPVPAVEVTFIVESGAGSISPEKAFTDSSGIARATWTLGTKTGPNTLSAQVAEVPAVHFAATAKPGPPARIIKRSGDSQTAEVTTQLPQELVAAVFDRYDNVVEKGTVVQWSVSANGGSVTPTSAATDDSGRVRTTWTLGTRSGTPTVSATAGAATNSFVASALPSTPVTVRKTGGDAQDGDAGGALTDSLKVTVMDRYDNPVPNVAVTWTTATGTIVSPSPRTGSDGTNRSQWRLGPATGPQTATATAPNVGSATFTATAREPLNLTLAKVVITQATQNSAGSLSLVEDRAAFMQVHVTTSRTLTVRPSVRVRFFRGGTQIAELSATGPGGGVPTAITEGDLTRTVNFNISASLLRRGTSMVVHVDPDNQIVEGNENDNVLPRGGTPALVDVRLVPTFNVRLVPVQIGSLTGGVTPANGGAFLDDTRRLLPVGSIDADVRSAFTSSQSSLSSSDVNTWSTVLNEIRLLRIADGNSRHYYGVVRVNYSSGLAGLGYLPGTAAIGWDYLPSGSSVAAHEWGHNFNRPHSPCGGASNPDPAYPYASGGIGTYGIDPVDGSVRSPSQFYDFMSYCNPVWTSDYTYNLILQYRGSQAGVAAAAARGTPTNALMLWGRISDREVVLEPAFAMKTIPVTPSPGPYLIEGRARDGSILFSTTFDAERVADVPHDERHFAFALPMSAADVERLWTLRLVANGKEARRETRALATAETRQSMLRDPHARVHAERTAGASRLQWNPVDFPFIVVRDPRSNEIVAFSRRGLVQLERTTDPLDVIVSDGVQSVPVRVLR